MMATELAQPQALVCKQKVDSSGKIRVSKVGWVARLAAITSFVILAGFIIEHAVSLNDPYVLIALAMPIHALIILLSSWVAYRNPASAGSLNRMPLVSVIMPVYNQRLLIDKVVDAIFASDYPNIEVVVVNDGSNDGTRSVLKTLAQKHEGLVVLNKWNKGKRRAIAAGFAKSRGQVIVFVDSDSLIHDKAITEMVKAFNHDRKIGAVVGHAKVWNKDENILTKIQDSWYDYSFNIQKACESVFWSVLCCSGCLAGYRREAIEGFIPQWSSSEQQYADDRELTSYAIADRQGKSTMVTMAKRKSLSYASQYDDADDRVLTANAMDRKWKSVYVVSAIVYTDVPTTFRQFRHQQLRWKKGTIRTNFFVSLFFWRRNPIMGFMYYFDMLGTYLAPLMTIAILLYEPLVLQQYWFPVYYIGVLLWKGFVLGLDYKFRDKTSASWKYKPVMVLLQTFFMSFLVFPALLQLNKNEWGTRGSAKKKIKMERKAMDGFAQIFANDSY